MIIQLNSTIEDSTKKIQQNLKPYFWAMTAIFWSLFYSHTTPNCCQYS